MTYHWADFVGSLGVAVIITAYLALQLGRLDGRSLSYSLANAVGAALIVVSLWHDFNFAALVIEVFWIAISLIGIVRALRKRGAKHWPDSAA